MFQHCVLGSFSSRQNLVKDYDSSIWISSSSVTTSRAAIRAFTCQYSLEYTLGPCWTDKCKIPHGHIPIEKTSCQISTLNPSAYINLHERKSAIADFSVVGKICPNGVGRKYYGTVGVNPAPAGASGGIDALRPATILSTDEADHIFAGYMSWKKADFGINPEHPPLVKALATVPLLAMHLRVPPPEGLPDFKHEAFADGRDFIFGNGGEAEADQDRLSRPDGCSTPSRLLLGLFVFFAGREMFGVGAGLFALALFVFEPNIIAHGAYVTTDIGLSCFLFAGIYALYRYVKTPSWGQTDYAGPCLWVGARLETLGCAFTSDRPVTSLY